ncbi:MAG TPA: hypothetical protein VMU41_14335 [Candidatus Binataceae bacterium]|nr:hypothetical protein [Candidatus Binataceae bacterium]
MFRLFRRQSQQEAKLESVLDTLAVMHGQINVQHLIITVLIDLLDDPKRDELIAAFKALLGARFGGDPEWLDEGRKRDYNNTISAMLMSFIEAAEQPPPQSN